MKRACVIGWPITHSRSPLIHGHWLKTYGIEGAYTREPVAPDAVADFLATLGDRGFSGCNVTLPHKEAAFAASALRELSAVAVGAANTIWFEGGELACANTDTYGFMANLDSAAPGWRSVDGPIVVLGAGGSARAVIHGFLEAGRDAVRVVNRSVERANLLAAHFGRRVTVHDWASRSDQAAEAAVIVNTTSLGMNGEGDPGIDFSRSRTGAVAADLVYTPMETAFLSSASASGLTPVDGLGMLLHQAAPGFEKWFGVRPVVTRELYDLIARDIEGR